jgi:hypothetical protein
MSSTSSTKRPQLDPTLDTFRIFLLGIGHVTLNVDEAGRPVLSMAQLERIAERAVEENFESSRRSYFQGQEDAGLYADGNVEPYFGEEKDDEDDQEEFVGEGESDK